MLLATVKSPQIGNLWPTQEYKKDIKKTSLFILFNFIQSNLHRVEIYG